MGLYSENKKGAIKARSTTSEGQSCSLVFRGRLLVSQHTASHAASAVCLGRILFLLITSPACTFFSRLWLRWAVYECLGCVGSGFFFLEPRALVAGFQRDVTSSGVTPGNRGGAGGFDSHPSQPCAPNSLASPRTTDHFTLLEIQYMLIFSLSPRGFTAWTGPTNASDFTTRHYSLWLQYKILQSCSAVFFVAAYSGTLSDLRDELKGNDGSQLWVINPHTRVMMPDFYSLKKQLIELVPRSFHRLHLSRSAHTFRHQNISWKRRSSLYNMCMCVLFSATHHVFVLWHIIKTSPCSPRSRSLTQRAAAEAAEDQTLRVNYTSTTVEHLARAVFVLPVCSCLLIKSKLWYLAQQFSSITAIITNELQCRFKAYRRLLRVVQREEKLSAIKAEIPTQWDSLSLVKSRCRHRKSGKLLKTFHLWLFFSFNLLLMNMKSRNNKSEDNLSKTDLF